MATYFVSGNDHLVHLVRNPCYSLPLRFSVASYSLIKRGHPRKAGQPAVDRVL
jgi:hypothetical protein